MEHAALLSLHAALKLSAPAGGRGGLGLRGTGRAAMTAHAEPAPSPLFARFVKAGAYNPALDHVGADFAGKRTTFGEDGAPSSFAVEAQRAEAALVPAPAPAPVPSRVHSERLYRSADSSAIGVGGSSREAPSTEDTTLDWVKAQALDVLQAAAAAAAKKGSSSIDGALSHRRLVKRLTEASAAESAAAQDFDVARNLPRALMSLILDGAVCATPTGDAFALIQRS